MIGIIAIVLALGLVLGVLVAGVAVMAKGGAASARWSNVLMRYRIVAQAVALLVIAVVVYVASGH